MKLFGGIFGLIGLVGTVYGFWLAWEPLGYIVGGILVVLLGQGLYDPKEKGDRGQ